MVDVLTVTLLLSAPVSELPESLSVVLVAVVAVCEKLPRALVPESVEVVVELD